jgi:hypothetical protein
MIAIQSLTKTTKSKKSYNQNMTLTELFLFYTNAVLWKIKNPTIELVLFCDKTSLDELTQQFGKIPHDRVEVLPESNLDINTGIFWSVSKFQAYQQIDEPFIFIDNDMIIYDDISYWELNTVDITTSCVESVDCFCYDNPNKFFKKTPWAGDSYQWSYAALNCSFVSINNMELFNNYKENSMRWMRDASKNKPVKNMVFFIEQRFLGELVFSNNYTNKQLVRNLFTEGQWSDIEVDGLWNFEESFEHIFHLGSSKEYLRKGKYYDVDYDKQIISHLHSFYFLHSISIPAIFESTKDLL